ncbi:M23 family metallopeptidase [Streptomyces albus]|nr:M23 family metallopeptidase [Streptomyces albus]
MPLPPQVPSSPEQPPPAAPWAPVNPGPYGDAPESGEPWEDGNPTDEPTRALRGRHRVAKQRAGGVARGGAVLGVGMIAAVGAAGMATAHDKDPGSISVPDLDSVPDPDAAADTVRDLSDRLPDAEDVPGLGALVSDSADATNGHATNGHGVQGQPAGKVPQVQAGQQTQDGQRLTAGHQAQTGHQARAGQPVGADRQGGQSVPSSPGEALLTRLLAQAGNRAQAQAPARAEAQAHAAPGTTAAPEDGAVAGVGAPAEDKTAETEPERDASAPEEETAAPQQGAAAAEQADAAPERTVAAPQRKAGAHGEAVPEGLSGADGKAGAEGETPEEKAGAEGKAGAHGAEHARGYQAPLTSYQLGAGFGESGGMWQNDHTGQDFTAPNGTPVKAAGSGTVKEAGWAGAHGYRVVLRLEDGTELWFCHLSSMTKSAGDKVATGDVIGRVGSTGNSSGPHLHVEVRPDGGDPVDPLRWLRDKGVDA